MSQRLLNGGGTSRQKSLPRTKPPSATLPPESRASRPLNYIFTLDKYWSLDGSDGGSGAEFINHCCEPNLVARIIKGHIIYFSLRPILKGEELTVDYHFAKNVEKVPCCCGSAECRGTINVN